MSAIWGVIDKKKEVSQETVDKLKESMREFKLDRYDYKALENVCFACGHQYITKDAKKDVSPYYDEADKVWFTADCYLYNRKELIDCLINSEKAFMREALEQSGDAWLAYLAYKCYGETFVERLNGSFAVVIYRMRDNKLLMYADHLARRYLAYYNDGQTVCFASVYQPILALIGNRISLCDEWLCAAYTDCSADTVKLRRLTVYDKVFQVEPGHYVKLDMATDEVENICYFNPVLNRKKLPKMSDNEYKELFIKTFSRTIESMLRSEAETGIMLSGGLDSSAVAAFAAIVLDKYNKKLFSYTAVPAEGFDYENSRFCIENEKDMVLEHGKMYTNIVSRFISSDEVNCFTRLEDYVQLYKEPVKPALNMPNIEGMFQAAAEDGCRILLSGQNGNATISYGNILTLIYQNCLHGRLCSVYREAKAFCRFRGVSKKKLLSVFFNAVKEKHFERFSFGDDCFLKASYIKKYKLTGIAKRIQKERGNGFLDSQKQHLNFCFMPQVFQHMGFYDTYAGLKYGILSLDPTLTTDVIELCMSMPMECFVKNGKERRAVRDYMKGYVPDRILDNHVGRGVQAADFAYRVNRDWNKIREEVFEIIKEQKLLKYFDKEKLQQLLDEAENKEYSMDKDIVARLAVISSLGYFLKNFNESI